jgi:chromosome partitioning protein
MKRIAFANQKGGVGKTTSAVNTAAFLARTGKRVLLVDSDPQGNASSGLGIEKKGTSATVYDILINGTEPQKAVIQTEYKNLHIIPSGMDLVGAELELIDEARREFKLKDALDKLDPDYDVVIIDCPPSLGLVTINCLTAAEGVIIPLLCEFYSLEGLSQLTNTISHINKLYNNRLMLFGVLINMYDGRLNLTHQVMNEIKKYFSDKLFKTPIPRNVKLSEAPSFGMPISEYDRYSKGAIAYEAFTKELIERMKKY